MAKKAAKSLTAIKTKVNNESLIADPDYAAFWGHWRRPVKTSVARSGNRAVPMQRFGDLGELLASLVPDAKMRSKYPELKARSIKAKQQQQSAHTGPQQRNPPTPTTLNVP